IFGPMAKTYGYAIAGGLIATFTLSPALSALLLPDSVAETETAVVRVLRRLHEPVAEFCLANRVVTLGCLGILIVVAGFAVHSLGLEFLPKLEEGNFWIRATLPESISLEEGNSYVNDMRRLIKSFPEVETVISQHGRPDDGTDATGFFNAELFVPLKPFEAAPPGQGQVDSAAHAGAAGALPRRGVQLLAVHRGQRGGGRLGGEGREFDQAVRQRSADARANRQENSRRGAERAGCHRPGRVRCTRPAHHPHRHRPDAGCAVGACPGGYQCGGAGGHRRSGRGRSV